jgi:hypothetical protein
MCFTTKGEAAHHYVKRCIILCDCLSSDMLDLIMSVHVKSLPGSCVICTVAKDSMLNSVSW